MQGEPVVMMMMMVPQQAFNHETHQQLLMQQQPLPVQPPLQQQAHLPLPSQPLQMLQHQPQLPQQQNAQTQQQQQQQLPQQSTPVKATRKRRGRRSGKTSPNKAALLIAADQTPDPKAKISFASEEVASVPWNFGFLQSLGGSAPTTPQQSRRTPLEEFLAKRGSSSKRSISHSSSSSSSLSSSNGESEDEDRKVKCELEDKIRQARSSAMGSLSALRAMRGI